MSDPDEHNRLYLAATELLKREGALQSAPPARLGWFATRRIGKAISLLEQVVVLNPTNWAAMWITGKAYQALGRHEDALACFSKSLLLNDRNPDVGREAGISAMECGRPD